jgi:hypothetical protein
MEELTRRRFKKITEVNIYTRKQLIERKGRELYSEEAIISTFY